MIPREQHFLDERKEQAIVRRSRKRWSENTGIALSLDALVVEEPLEIRVGNFPLAVVMRTPGDDIDLVTGFAVTELIVKQPADLLRVAHCDTAPNDGEVSDDTEVSDGTAVSGGTGASGRTERSGENVVRIYTQPHISIDITRFQRSLYSTSSCGICGKRSIDRALQEAPPLERSSEFSAHTLVGLPLSLRTRQLLFHETGALHAAALFRADGTLELVREDIGRHNAVDKVIGAALRASIDPSCHVLVVSGRASYEVIQKALAARIPCVVAVGGVSSLAVSLADRAGVVLVGFAREGSMSVYSGAESVR